MQFLETPMSADDVIKHNRGYRYGYYQFHLQIQQWSIYIDELMKEPDEKLPKFQLEKLHQKWLTNLILYYQSWVGFRDVIPGQIRVFPAMDIFVELSRTFYLINRGEVNLQQQELDNAMFKTTLEDKNIHCFKLKHTDHFTEGFHKEKLDWDKPILLYTQQEVVDCLLMMTEKIDQLPYEAVPETRKILRLLYIRHGQFICQKNMTEFLNVPNFYDSNLDIPNRDYLTFATIYFHAVQRRLFYWDLMNPVVPPPKRCQDEAIERCRNWIMNEVYAHMTDENFDDIYKATYEEDAYVFPGDLDWYSYRYPDLPNFQIGPIIDCFRKEMTKKYYSEYRVSKETLLDSVNQNSHTGHCARLFMFNAIHQYISTIMTGVKFQWKDALVITNQMLESSSRELLRESGVKVPYFVQVFSRFCVYDVGNIYVSDNFYESFVIWLSLIRDKKNWGLLIDKIIEGHEPAPEYIGYF